MFDIPRAQGAAISHPSAAVSIDLLGGALCDGIVFTRDQVKRLTKLYGIEKGEPGSLEEAGSFRNLTRLVKRDGMRVMAVLSQFVEQGQDPVKALVQMAADQGYDVGEMFEWANDEDPEHDSE